MTLNGKNTMWSEYQIIVMCALFNHSKIENWEEKYDTYDKYLKALLENEMGLARHYFNKLNTFLSQDRKHIHEFLKKYDKIKENFKIETFDDVYEDDVIGVLAYYDD